MAYSSTLWFQVQMLFNQCTKSLSTQQVLRDSLLRTFNVQAPQAFQSTLFQHFYFLA